MSFSPTFIMNPTRGEEEEEMLAIDPGRSHTPPPGSWPNSRLEILIMDMARSTEQRLENFARAQSEQLAHMTGRLSSLKVSLHGTPLPSPTPAGRGSHSSST